MLIVLGMLAFMVISAVAFSAYMRYSRLPSSYLRRSSPSRLLVKAALAEAIDEIDSAIGNNPHPGIGQNAYTYDEDDNSRKNGTARLRNVWKNRIYLGTNSVSSLLDPDATVSTLTLEGLAYIPPALVNDARYYSRRSMAGQWKNFAFDTGRYAFCAIDVSDHLNVNTLSAGVARDSSAAGRFSLAYLFENASQHSSYESDPGAWESFLKAASVRTVSPAEQSVKQGFWGSNQKSSQSGASCVPFVSLADFNLALYDKRPAGWTSLFGDYVANEGSSFYGGISAESPEADKIRRQSFVTDSYFPPTAYASDEDADYDLSDEEYQPFDKADLESDTPSLTRFINQSSRPTAKLLFDRLSAFGLATLYDYLDDDNVPVSLAFPSVERIPMIAGIGSEKMDTSTIKINPTTKYTDDPTADGYSGVKTPGTESRIVEQITYYNISGTEFVKFLQEGFVKAVVAYPFRRGADTLNSGAAQKFTLEGTLSVFFATGTCGSRDGGDLLMVDSDASFTDKSLPAAGACSVFHVPLKFSDYSNYSFDTVDTVQDAVREVQARLSENALASQIGTYFEKPENAVLTVTEQWTQNAIKDEITKKVTWTPATPPEGSVISALSAIRPISGGVAQGLGDLKTGSKKVSVRSALWLRLKNGNGKTVDLVPAGTGDDRSFLGVGVTTVAAQMLGTKPLMLAGGTELEIGVEALKGMMEPVALSSLGPNVMCVDPRWNWAPEHWYQPSAAVTKDAWIAAVGGEDNPGFIAKNGRECDMFLTSSDAGYMQSVYELAFLPRWTDLKSYGNSQFCGNMTKLGSAGQTTFETDPEKVVNSHMMWRSYHPFATDTGAARDDFEELGIVNKGGGFKMTPYSDNTNAMMAVFANTPFDWWAACKNTESRSGKMPHISQSERLNAKDFNKNYAFNEMNSDAKFMWKDLQAIAQRFIARMHANPNADWIDVYNGLGWDEEDFMDINLSGDELYDVDRKFLYGYWRECFAVQQQLFLVFVRAEPTMMGGGAVGQTPPALGARAVALVWRDPTKTQENNAPHQTRILFYRQFD